jgi:hypothetical protein
MKYEDYEAKLTELVKNPDSAALAVQDILKDLKADSETFASLEANVAAQEGRIKDLQDTNMKLFLRQTGGDSGQEPEEKTADEVIDELFKEE